MKSTTQDALWVLWGLSMLHQEGMPYASLDEIFNMTSRHYDITKETFDSVINEFQNCLGLFYVKGDSSGIVKYRLGARGHSSIFP